MSSRLAPAAALALALGGCVSHAPPDPATRGAADATPRPVEVVEVSVARRAVQCPVPVSLQARGHRGTGEAPERDLWSRLRRGLMLAPRREPSVERQLRWYASHPAYLSRVAERASRYLYHVVEAVQARGLPMELALLPIVESAFDPYAYSHGQAAGLWQFIPGTGRRYGLERDWWHDQRRDVIASTRAALDYLQDLHRMFDGDWLLAVAAYNAGPGNVRQALRRNRRRDRSTEFFDLDLPRETRAYVPKLLALQRLVAEPEAHGIELPSIADQPYFRVVKSDGQLDLALAAELAEVEMAKLYQLNPALNRWATHPGGPHRLLVPVAAAERLEAALAELPEDERVAWKRHRIRPGETLSEIAARYATTTQALRRANRLSGDTIRAGDALLIPTATSGAETYALSERGRQERRDAHYAQSGLRKVRYRVRPGDSLWEIARGHDVSVRRVASWNGMAPGDILREGSALTLWLPQARRATPPGDREGVVRRLGYRVRRGDSLWKIASRFAVSVDEIQQWNSLTPGEYLQPGQRLTLFVDVTEAP